MNQQVTRGIVLARTNYGEADRIVTMLTPDQGKLRLMAKGVRKPKSKLAGGIELFSVSDITFIRGKSDLSTLISARLHKHYSQIVQDIDRTMLGYELIKQLHRATEDEPEFEYFTLMEQIFMGLDDAAINSQLLQQWFSAQLLRIAGHSPNLQTDTTGQKLKQEGLYTFSFEDMAFMSQPNGKFSAKHIKILRLLFSASPLKAIAHVQDIEPLIEVLAPVMQTMRALHLRM
jgi:DNA repair protein RecO